MADNAQVKTTYKLRQNYHQHWSCDESKLFSHRTSFLSQRETIPFIPSREKSKILYYCLKYTTVVKYQHLFESFITHTRKFLKWRDDDLLERSLTKLIESPGEVSEVVNLPPKQKQELMNIVDQLKDRKEEIMMMKSNIPLEFGEDMKVKDFAEELKEEELLLSDDEAEPLPPVKTKAPETFIAPKKNPEEEKARSEEVKKAIQERMIPEKKETRDKNFNHFKSIIEKRYPPKLDNVEIIYRILKLVTSNSKDDTIQEDIIGLTGYSQLDMLSELLARRAEIKSYMKTAFKGIKGLEKKNPTVDDIIVILQILGLELGNIQAKYPKHYALMEESTVSTTIHGGDAIKQESKDFTVTKFKAAAKDPHKEISRIPLSVFPPWSQVKC